MKAVVTVIGQDKVGIIAKVTNQLAENNINILDITQTIMGDLFTMIMLVNMKESSKGVSEMSELFKKTGEELGVEIGITLEEIYKSMHRI